MQLFLSCQGEETNMSQIAERSSASSYAGVLHRNFRGTSNAGNVTGESGADTRPLELELGQGQHVGHQEKV